MDDELGDGVGVVAAKPCWWIINIPRARDVLCVVEFDVPICVWVGSAIKCAKVEEEGLSVFTQGWKKLVEEGGGAVEQDGLGSEEEVGVVGFGIFVAVELVLGDNAWAEVVAFFNVGFGLAWDEGERG